MFWESNPLHTQNSTYFVEHPEIESLQTSFAKAGYATYGGGKLVMPNGNHMFIDARLK